MVSTSKLRGTWKGGGFVGNDANVVIALYVNAVSSRIRSEERSAQLAEQRACFTILKEWVRQHLDDVFKDHMTEVDGRGYLFEFHRIEWGNKVNPFYLLLRDTLKEMADAFNLHPHSNCSTPYALEYSWVKASGMEYDTVRLGAYAYAVGVKVETEVAGDFLIAEEL
jgi:hypothetical protein